MVDGVSTEATVLPEQFRKFWAESCGPVRGVPVDLPVMVIAKQVAEDPASAGVFEVEFGDTAGDWIGVRG